MATFDIMGAEGSPLVSIPVMLDEAPEFVDLFSSIKPLSMKFRSDPSVCIGNNVSRAVQCGLTTKAARFPWWTKVASFF